MNSFEWPDRRRLDRLRSEVYRRDRIETFLTEWTKRLIDEKTKKTRIGNGHKFHKGPGTFLDLIDGFQGINLEQRWNKFQDFWTNEVKGEQAAKYPTQVFQVPVLMRLTIPSTEFLYGCKPLNWCRFLMPPEAPISIVFNDLEEIINRLPTHAYAESTKRYAEGLGAKLILAQGYWAIEEFKEADLFESDDLRPLRNFGGRDALDAALCLAGVFRRTSQRGIFRRRGPMKAPTLGDMVEKSKCPDHFKDVTLQYLLEYSERISSKHGTLRAKLQGLTRFWSYIGSVFPEILSSSQIRPHHVQAYIPHCIASAQANCRQGSSGIKDGTVTANHDMANVRTFFTDISIWSLEAASRFATHAPPAVPISFRDMQRPELTKAFRQKEAAMTRRIIDLEREMPKVRALAFEDWQLARDELARSNGGHKLSRIEAVTFWDWAILELLLQSGLRIEEAHNLTIFDILKRKDSSGRTYFLLHVEPSKFDKARLIPIGDTLAKVLSEIIIHVKKFHGSNRVPPVDHFDFHERKPLPRAPYLLQSRTRPQMIGLSTIRQGMKELSRRAGITLHDGRPLGISPHDCRRVFASEHLNNGTPPHVLRALLGHERLDTVMIYAKLYPNKLVEEYRRHIGGVYQAIHGPEVLRAPSEEEWQELERSCDLRDMGTHLCALPAGDHCPKGLVCLGCVHAQPKKSALPQFESMHASHRRQLKKAEERHEPLGQLASRRLEVTRLENAIKRARELTDNAAASMERALVEH